MVDVVDAVAGVDVLDEAELMEVDHKRDVPGGVVGLLEIKNLIHVVTNGQHLEGDRGDDDAMRVTKWGDAHGGV